MEGVHQVLQSMTPGTFVVPVGLIHSGVVVDEPRVVMGPTASAVETEVARALASGGFDRTGV